MPIYTKKGDRGETGLPGKRRLSKTDQLFEVLGNLDQTSASIGLALSYTEKKESELIALLKSVQSDFLGIGAYLASENHSQRAILNHLPKQITLFEKTIDKLENETGSLQNFILPGGGNAGSALHLARTIARKTEREFHNLTGVKSPEISQYLNRLSDLLFQIARAINHRQGNVEDNWKYLQNKADNR
ncbi:MAG: cob(I)yrinic acid a,c-diamide adenosyltransferase [Patescibacteria group bacterium]